MLNLMEVKVIFRNKKNKFLNAVTASKSGTFQLVLEWIWKGTNLKKKKKRMDKGREGQGFITSSSETA